MNNGESDPLPKKSPAPNGTYNLWIDCAEESDVFEKGIRQRLGEFHFGDELCVVSSEGPTLAATLRLGSENPQRLFRIPMALPRTRRRHLITIGWSKGTMKILLDSKAVAEVPLTFVMWFASVNWVLWTH